MHKNILAIEGIIADTCEPKCIEINTDTGFILKVTDPSIKIQDHGE